MTYRNNNNKLFIFILLSIFLNLITKGINAQEVNTYSFTQSTGTYSTISSSTEIATATSPSGAGSIDDQSYTLTDVIPFPFNFKGEEYTSLVVFANGYITCGSTTSNTSSPISSSIGYEGIISPLGCDLISLLIDGKAGNISYKNEGVSPNRKFIIQWEHFKQYSSTATLTNYQDLSFQLILNESGEINIVYNINYIGTPGSFTSQVGLRGSNNSDYNNRSAAGNADNNWNSSVSGSSNSQTISTNVSFLPPSGLTFTYSPPLPCESPTAQPSELSLSYSGIIINGSFNPSMPASDRYLVLRNTSGTTPNPPIDGTVYPSGENVALNSYVSMYSSSTTFENNYFHGIKGNTEYVYTIYSVNSTCTGGPKYNVVSPLSESVINCPMGVNGITASDITTTSFQLNWPTPENGNALPYNIILEVALDNAFDNQVAGSPFTSTALNYSVSGLDPNTQYFYRAKNVSSLCESSYSIISSIYTSCVPISEFNESFDGVSGVGNLPNCWSKILDNGTELYTPTINLTTTGASSAPNNISFYGNGADMSNPSVKAILVSPELTNVGAGTHRLKFKARHGSSGNTSSLKIVALSDNTISSIIEEIDLIPSSELTDSYQEFTIYFTDYSGTASYLGLQRIDGNSYSYLYIDDVIWEEVPSCLELNELSVSDITPTSASISWTDISDPPTLGYEYYLSTSSTLPLETATFTSTSSLNASLEELSTGTTYYVFVRRICSESDKSEWSVESFNTLIVKPAPWFEDFHASATVPDGWSATGWTINNQRGATGVGISPINIFKNLYSGTPTGTFETPIIGPIDADDYELNFSYKQSNFNSPYNPLSDWGNYNVEISTDFGTTWTTIATIDNEAGTGSYISKNYSLASYEGNFVKIKISANRTSGDFDLSFDQFEIKKEGTTNPFCLPEFELSSTGNMITQVTFNTIDNTSPFTSGSTPNYEDFTTITTTIQKGQEYLLTVKGPSSTYPSDVMAYIDFNQNGIYDDVGEGFYIGRIEPEVPANAHSVSSLISIPESAIDGNTTIRIIKNTNVASLSDSEAPNSISGPCATDLRSGQVEAYSLNIIESPLASVLGNLKVKNIEPNNVIKWRTLSEETITKMILEKSIDGINFEPLDKIETNGYPSEYSYNDNNLTLEKNYYRVYVVDILNNTTYSNIASVTNNKSKESIVSIFPNPTSDQITISILENSKDPIEIIIIDVNGKIAKSLNFNDPNQISVSFKDLNYGIYFLNCRINNRNNYFKIIKQ